MVHMIPSHRDIGDGVKANIKGMHGEGVATSKIVGYMAGMAGGYSNLGFSKKDAYNFVDRERRASIADGDANATIVYLESQAGADPMAEARFLLTKSGTSVDLFWTDGPSRVDYQHFGDVVAFDSTYKKNKYKRPLVIFCGVNNHKQACIFGFGILEDERAESYKWLLENMLDVMCDKKPSVVVTDEDKATIEAIREVFPEATHRLCAWHIEKNVTTNAKESELRSLFNCWLYADISVEEFEAEWAEAFVDFGLCDSMWASQMYEKRHMWENAYLRDKFCSGFRTTSRCEGINSYVKKLTSSRSTLLELVQDLEMLLREYRNNELAAQFNSINEFPVLTTCLREIERCAAKLYIPRRYSKM
ncbi:hypothetical protein PIB30_119137 [Stylosanthes scabra]|uniref:MULE transposase domain-containing protein n=1 Tax=Stylosanthes scabra TaxID=79078 RepID=A0ABU6Y897_9FABA|nr:hypothetical protein [Stylosanthes scabra]